VATLLESAGATTQPLSPIDRLLEACGRGDVEAARRLGSPELLSKLEPADRLLMVDAASSERWTTVLACLAAGFPVDAQDGSGATALHYAAIHGHTSVVRALLQVDADFNIRDKEHSSTPLGWATFGSDHVRGSPGDYEGTVRALLEAGARPRNDEYYPQSPGLRKLLREFKPA
jgi:ankyrin repeat protein